MSTTAEPRLLYPREVERLYRLRHGTVRGLINAKKLATVRRGRRTFVTARDVQIFFGATTCA